MKPLTGIAVLRALVLISLTSAAATIDAPADDLPSGMIVMWSGPLDAIPDGWALCDGSRGTPDLRNRFVLGVGAVEYMGSTGGSQTHRHQDGKHTHQIDPPATRLRPLPGYYGNNVTGSRGHYYTFPAQTYDLRPFTSGTATTSREPTSSLPPYYKLAFIMKL